jgi:hypothetical protein
LHLFLPRFEACWGEPITQPVGFFDTPAAFEGVDPKVVLIQSIEDLVKEFKMSFPGSGEGSNIVDVAFTVDASKGEFHYFLSNVR